MSVQVSTIVRLVDDDPMVLRAVGRLLRAEGFRTQSNTSAEEFLSRLDPNAPGCVVLDLALPGQSGLQLQRTLRERNIDLPIIFISGTARIADSVEALKHGAIDFLVKPVEGDLLVPAVSDAIERDRRNREHRERLDAMAKRLETLTRREHELLPYLVSGRLNKQIAADVGVVEKTVKVHRTRVMHKLGAKHLVDLVRFAEEAHVVPVSGRTKFILADTTEDH